MFVKYKYYQSYLKIITQLTKHLEIRNENWKELPV